MTAQVDASHPSGFVHMRKWAFEKFPALAHQAPAARAANPAAVSIYRVACLRIVLPVAWPAIGLRDVAAHPYRFERHQRLIAVVSFVRHQLFGPLAVSYDRFDLLGSLNQCFDTGGSVPLICVLHGHAHHGAGLQVDRVLRLVCQVRASIFHLGDLGVRVMRMGPIVIGAFVLSLAIDARQVLASGRLYARGLRQLGEKLLIALAAVASHDTAQCRIGFKRGCVNTNRLPVYQPRFGELLKIQVKTSRCVSRSINRRVREIVEWSGAISTNSISRNRRSAKESAARQAIARSESSPSKYPINNSRK